MRLVMSALVMSVLFPIALQAQGQPNRFSRTTSADSIRARPIVLADIYRANGDSMPTAGGHAVRNGAMFGVVVGAVAGGYGGSLMGTGCKAIAAPPGQPQPECHDRATHNQFIIAGAALGGFATGLVGAAAGKLWQLLD